MNNNQRQPRYGLRKIKIGVASVILGFTFMVANNSQVHADEGANEITQQKIGSSSTRNTGQLTVLNNSSKSNQTTNTQPASPSTVPSNSSSIVSQPTSSATKEDRVSHGPADNATSHNDNTTYSKITGYQAIRDAAYANVAKLQPMSNDSTIVHDGNLISANDPLYKTQIMAAVPVNDKDQFIVNSDNPSAATGLVVAFTDGRMQRYSMNYQETTPDHLLEYQLADGLHYTPLQSASVDATIVNDLIQTLNRVDLFSNEMKTKLKVSTDDQIRDLYLTNSFNQVKQELNTLVPDLLANSSTGKTLSNPTVIAQKIKDNKLAVMLGLSYINRLYNIQFGQYNILPLMMFRPDFFGAQIDGLDWLIKIGNLSASQLTVKNNLKTFNADMAPTLHAPALISFLARTLQELAPGLDAEAWFRSNTGAYIYEVPSKEVPTANVHIYHRLSTSPNLRYRSFILPLLNMKENDMYIVTTMATTTYGLPDRYINQKFRSDSTVFQQKVQQVDQRIKEFADDWGHYFDFWYRMTNDSGKRLMLTSNIPIWDSYWIQDSTIKGGAHWINKYDTTIPAIADFFGPVGDMYKANGTAAYATGSCVHFVVFDALDPVGTSTMTHEMTHNFDGSIYFDGYGRRQSEGPESFAEGLLQSVASATPTTYGLNLVFDFSNASPRTTNATPDMFKTPADIGNLMHGVFDVTYLLDYAEAQSMLPQSVADKELVYNQISYDPTSNADVVTTIDDSTAAKLTSLDSLIDNNIIAKRAYKAGKYGKNIYERIALYAPDYAGLENPNGSTGGITFRKTAFELLAAKGWQDGFLPYVSNEYKQSAAQDGQVFSDQYILNKMFNNKYRSYADFKKDMFAERIAKKELIKPITIRFNRKTVKINNYNDLANLMNQAVNLDLARLHHGSSQRFVDQLKQAVFQAYNAKTNDFKASIFKSPSVSKLTVRFVDSNPTAAQDLSNDTLILSGTFNSAIGNQVNQTINDLTQHGYKVVSNDFIKAGTLFNSENNGQTYTVKLNHLTTMVNATDPKSTTDSLPDNHNLKYPAGLSTDDLQKTVQREITIDDPHNGSKTINQKVIFTRQATVDEVTGQCQYSNWQTSDQAEFPATKAPSIPGYTAQDVPAWSAQTDGNQKITVKYQPISQTLTISMVDQNGKVIAIQTINGQTDQTVPLKISLPAGWQLANDGNLPSSWTVKPSGNQLTIQIKAISSNNTNTPIKPQSETGQPLVQPTNPAYDLNKLKQTSTGTPLTEPTKPTFDLNKLKQTDNGEPLAQPTNPAYDLNKLKQSSTSTPLTEPTKPTFDLSKLKQTNNGKPLAQPTDPTYDLNKLKQSSTGTPLTEPTKPTFDLSKLKQTNNGKPLAQPTDPAYDLNKLKQSSTGTPLTEPTKPTFDLSKLKQTDNGEPLVQPTNPAYDLNKLKQSSTGTPLTEPTKPTFDLSKLKQTDNGESLVQSINSTYDSQQKAKTLTQLRHNNRQVDVTSTQLLNSNQSNLKGRLGSLNNSNNNIRAIRLKQGGNASQPNQESTFERLLWMNKTNQSKLQNSNMHINQLTILPRTGNHRSILAIFGLSVIGITMSLLGKKHQN